MTHSASVSQSYSSSIDSASVTPSASASYTSASQTSPSTPSTTVCTATATAPASITVTTTTITSLVNETTTTAVSTTESISTAVPTTVPITATTVVTSTVPPATPTVVLRAAGASVGGQYLQLRPSDVSYITFTSDLVGASSFYLTSSGSLASVAYADTVALYSKDVGSSSYVIFGSNGVSNRNGGVPMSCQYSSPTNIGSTGLFTCPNGGSAPSNFAALNNLMNVQSSSGAGSVLTLQYTVLS
ncbi:hypothetical protein PG991_008908 [Apiospora marii]|uniref:REJ domain-containing protein n=1 Tax=Apiospora marii TaxID=335849 RepID=A0ABR1RM34_9PEZI